MSEQSAEFPWPQASASGVGSMPGTDVVQTCRMVFGELPDLPFLPELPDRGPGADMTGRAAALLVGHAGGDHDQGLEAGGHTRPGDQPGGRLLVARTWTPWRRSPTGFAGALKVQVCGPITLAATLELTRSLNPALSDQGALADLTDSLAEGVAAHVADVRRRVPGATVILQLDEPALPAALAGRVRTASGLNVVRALEPVIASQRLSTVLAGPGGQARAVVHCCARDFPFPVIAEAGATGIGFDLGLLGNADVDPISELGRGGAWPAGRRAPDAGGAAARQRAAAAAAGDGGGGHRSCGARPGWRRSAWPASW